MARKTKTNLTFQVTLRDLEGVKIPDARAFIKSALELTVNALDPAHPCKQLDIDKVTIHLTNKETSYA
jgi:pyoverdine/dityrosine biosynthesis protein Dit1